MKKFMLPIALLLLALPLVSAKGVSLGIGLSGGLTYPILQDNEGNGSNITARAIFRPIPFLGFEGTLTRAKYGKPDISLEGISNNLEGSDLTAYGLNAILGGGGGLFSMFFIGGIGYFNTSRDQTIAFDRDKSDFGYTGGLGMAFGLIPQLALDIRAQLHVVPVHEHSSRKFAFVMAGLNFYIVKI